MGYGRLNIWIRDDDCSLLNCARVDLEIKTCLGENLIDIIPEPALKKLLSTLEERFPESTISHGDNYDTRTIRIQDNQWRRFINNVPLKIPPGCYVVRVHVCGERNEWSDKAMVMVSCGCEVCVNLIIKDVDKCVRDIIIPVLREVEPLKLPPEQLRAAVDVLRRAGRMPIEVIERNLNDRVRIFGELKGDRPQKIVSQARTTLELLREFRKKKEERRKKKEE